MAGSHHVNMRVYNVIILICRAGGMLVLMHSALRFDPPVQQTLTSGFTGRIHFAFPKNFTYPPSAFLPDTKGSSWHGNTAKSRALVASYLWLRNRLIFCLPGLCDCWQAQSTKRHSFPSPMVSAINLQPRQQLALGIPAVRIAGHAHMVFTQEGLMQYLLSNSNLEAGSKILR